MANVANTLETMNNQQTINVATINPTATRKEVAFRMFGTSFNDRPNVTIREALHEAGADYAVEKQPLIRVPQSVVDAIQNGMPISDLQLSASDIITSHMATRRTDADITLGVVGRDYGVVQNTKAFDFIDFFEEVSGHKPIIENVGALGEGERMFVTARLGEDSYLDPNDSVKNYVVFTNSHDGSGSVMAFFTPIRVVCQNTLNMAIRGCQNKITFKHTKYVEHRLDWEREDNRRKAYAVFSQSVKFSEEFIAKMLQLKEQTIDDIFRKDFTARMFLDPAKFKLYQQADRNLEAVEEIGTRAKNLIYALNDAVESGVGQENHKGTKLWLINGVTTFLHNNRTYRSAEDEFKSLMEGDGAKKVQLAYDLLTA